MAHNKNIYLFSTLAALIIGISGSICVIRQERHQKVLEQNEIKQIERELTFFEQETSVFKKRQGLQDLIAQEIRYKQKQEVDPDVVNAFEEAIAKEQAYFGNNRTE